MNSIKRKHYPGRISVHSMKINEAPSREDNKDWEIADDDVLYFYHHGTDNPYHAFPMINVARLEFN